MDIVAGELLPEAKTVKTVPLCQEYDDLTQVWMFVFLFCCIVGFVLQEAIIFKRINLMFRRHCVLLSISKGFRVLFRVLSPGKYP